MISLKLIEPKTARRIRQNAMTYGINFPSPFLDITRIPTSKTIVSGTRARMRSIVLTDASVWFAEKLEP